MTKALVRTLLVAAALTVMPATSQASTGSVAAAGYFSYLPATIVVQQGEELTFANLDPSVHTLTSTSWDADVPMFDSGFVGAGQSAPVVGVPSLRANTDGYEFFCQVHPSMRGRLLVVAAV